MFSYQQKKLILHYYRMQQEKRQLKTKPKNYGPINKHICNIHPNLLCFCNACNSQFKARLRLTFFMLLSILQWQQTWKWWLEKIDWNLPNTVHKHLLATVGVNVSVKWLYMTVSRVLSSNNNLQQSKTKHIGWVWNLIVQMECRGFDKFNFNAVFC